MKYPYGYITKTKGMDGEEVDVFVGPNEQAPNVYVIMTNKAPSFSAPDEEKCMLGFVSAEEAKKAFHDHYSDERFFRAMRTVPYDQFVETVRRRKKVANEITDAPGIVEKDLGTPMEGAPHIILEPKDYRGRIEEGFEQLEVPQTNVP
jgi:hypothetical protein